mgnify:CR=1 FL=1
MTKKTHIDQSANAEQKNNAKGQDTESGFVALFFVLIFASALGFLLLSISLKSKNMLVLLGNMRDAKAARSSADYCLQKLLANKISNIGYRPLIDIDIEMPEGLLCRYKSFIETSGVGTIQVQRGSATRSANILQSFTVHILGVYIRQGQRVGEPIKHEIIREFYITDSL